MLAIRQAMFVLIGWILAAAPVGACALVLTLTAQLGGSAAGADTALRIYNRNCPLITTTQEPPTCTLV